MRLKACSRVQQAFEPAKDHSKPGAHQMKTCLKTRLLRITLKPLGHLAFLSIAFLFLGQPLARAANLTSSDGAAVDYFGISVALSGNMGLVGASGADIGVKDN